MQLDPTKPLEQYDAQRKGFNRDFRLEANRRQDFEGQIQAFGAMAAQKWGHRSLGGNHGMRGDGAARGDAQIANASECALRAIIAGFYLKPPRKTYWADGRYVTITDRGVHPGADKLEYHTGGGRYSSPNDGITQDDQSPEYSVDIAEDVTTQKFFPVKHKIKLSWQEIQKANLQGFDALERKGQKLREQHAFDLNNLIRRGNRDYGLTGICNHPGIRRRVAVTDWGGSLPADIYDEYNAAIRQMYASPTEEDIPQHSVLPRIQYNYFQTTQFSTATDSKLKGFIEGAYSEEDMPHTVMSDPGMAGAGRLGGPAALFYTNDSSLIRVTMPYYMRLLEPFYVSREVFEVEIISRFAGVQVIDTDTVLVVDGESAGWEAPQTDQY